MKKVFLAMVAITMIFASCNDDTKEDEKILVGTDPMPRNVVLEEFTGTNCGWCPAGHLIGKELSTANPGRVVLINIHAGSFAPMYTTVFGEAIDDFCQVGGYPAGAVNRELFGSNTTYAMGRGEWTSAANTVMGGTSPVNIGAESIYDEATGQLTITVELYYTADEAGGNLLNVCVTENNIEGPQSGKDKNPDAILPSGQYNHTHMFRDLVTGQWGESITETTTGSKVTKEYTYTPDPTWKIDDIELAIFVTKADKSTIHTGIVIPAKNGTTEIL